MKDPRGLGDQPKEISVIADHKESRWECRGEGETINELRAKTARSKPELRLTNLHPDSRDHQAKFYT